MEVGDGGLVWEHKGFRESEISRERLNFIKVLD